ncbi:MAG: 1-(5-phosphoribosyl)-5-[(5-phosphoribosylamino)methylideneamino]imidazole-4-carboxamide isomerase [Gammaproteobacteria bacterium]|nr:1-(5-phosphoribosyl)-5-[(5-phosphoribosylamino)methylideneamino]imidazole-4-carboxamide isomerase [Gammaproteobacteria bacterium]
MLIIPAIDLKQGQCVRLRQGRMEDATVFSDDPAATAKRWQDAGCRRLHVVDLDGAFAGRPENKAAVRAMVSACPDLPIQLGGGVRTLDTIESYLDLGLQWVIIGTQAVKEPAFVKAACHAFPGHIIVGVDAHDGWVATEGWAEASTVSAVEVVKQFAGDGVSSVVYTDIGRDGMLSGVNVEATAQLARETGCPVIASGGLRDLEDIRALLAVSDHGILGAITGRAIYEGTLSLSEALALTEEVG